MAIARELAGKVLVPFMLDKTDGFGTGTRSGRREVIHAGIYYEPGSLKAVLCREGRDRLYDYCTRHSVPHRRVGKLIFASEHSQLREIERIWTLASANGVHRSEEHTSELQSLMRLSYAVFCLKKKYIKKIQHI